MRLTISMPITAAIFAAAVFAGATAQAQVPDADSGTVTANGTVTISRQPETMRVQIAIQAKGATLKDALANAKTRTEAARKLLTALGAGKDSIKVADAKIAGQANEQQQQRQMQRMMMQRLNNVKAGKGAKKAAKTPDPVLVSALLTAEWKLESKTADELLLSVHALQEKIKAADLAGTKDAEKLSPEQEELLEEMEDGNSLGYNGNEGPKPGEPVFLFVSRISEPDRDKALAEAFQKAKVEATRVAKAAGAELASLKSLSAQNNAGDAAMSYNYNSYAYQAIQAARMAQAQSGVEDEDNATEALGADPGPVKFNVTVMAAFDLKRGK